MAISNTIVVVLVVLVPVVFFSIAFTLAVIYRRYRARRAATQQWTFDPQHAGQHENHAPGCALCEEKVEFSPEAGPLGQAFDTTAVDRRPSTAMPHFAEKPITMRRLSANPSIPDTIQRVNSITSTLLTQADPSSDSLPYGGRKSSVGSGITYKELKGTDLGVVAMGERRPSILNDPAQGSLDVRRVSVGGHEDLVRVRSASQSTLTVSGTATYDPDDPIEVLPTPTTPHPFAAVGLARITSSSVGTASTPLTPPSIPPVPPDKKVSRRPDSIVLAMSKPELLLSADPRAGQAIPTSTSTTAMKSPASSLSSEDEHTAGIFEAWRGFPSVDRNTLPPDEEQRKPSLVSPTTHSTPPLLPVSESAPPLPTFEVQDPEEPIVVPCRPLPGVPATPTQIFTLAVEIDGGAGKPSVGQNTPVNDINHNASPVMVPSPGSAKITYLADVVKENQEQRKSQMSMVSASLEPVNIGRGGRRGSILSLLSHSSSTGKAL